MLPVARRHVRQPPLLKTGPAALVGRSARVLEEVSGHSGRVRIGGEEWSARSYDETLVIPVGHKVDVMQIEGATALVYHGSRASFSFALVRQTHNLEAAREGAFNGHRGTHHRGGDRPHRLAHRGPLGADHPAGTGANVERFGRYRKTLEPGLNFIVPFVDRVKTQIDLREQVVSFDSQPVITEDNLVVKIDTVLFFQVTDPKAADYEIVNYIQAIEQLTATMLRSVIGSMDLEQTLTSREKINTLLRGVLDDASGKWGIRMSRVEIKAIDPPKSVEDAMEKQMRAVSGRSARRLLTAEGARLNHSLTASASDRAEQDPARRGRQAGRDPPGRGRGAGHRPGLPVDPPQRPGPEAARLPVPADPAAAGQRRGQHVLGDPQRGDDGTEGGDLGVRRRRCRRPGLPPPARPPPAPPPPARPPPARPRPAATPAPPALDAMEQAPPPAIARQPGAPEIAAQQQGHSSDAADRRASELATDLEQAVPASVSPPGLLNGSGRTQRLPPPVLTV